MFKYKKITLYFLTLLFIIFSLIELIIYLSVDSNVFGLIYMIINIIIVFLLVPCVYNYKKYYNVVRISKFILIVVLGIINSYILGSILINNISYSDNSINFIKKICIIKNYLKGIVYFGMIIITILEFRKEKLIKKSVD